MKRPADQPAFCLSSDLDQRPARGRHPGAAATARRFWLTRRSVAFPRARQLFRLRRDRAFDELEADLVLVRRLVLDQHDADMSAALELAEQDLVRKRLL